MIRLTHADGAHHWCRQPRCNSPAPPGCSDLPGSAACRSAPRTPPPSTSWWRWPRSWCTPCRLSEKLRWVEARRWSAPGDPLEPGPDVLPLAQGLVGSRAKPGASVGSRSGRRPPARFHPRLVQVLETRRKPAPAATTAATAIQATRDRVLRLVRATTTTTASPPSRGGPGCPRAGGRGKPGSFRRVDVRRIVLNGRAGRSGCARDPNEPGG